MKTVGSLLFAALFVALMTYKVKPEWFRPARPKLTPLRLDPVANTRAACDAYAQQTAWFAVEVEAAGQRIAAAGTDQAASRAELARLATYVHASLPRLRAVEVTPVPIGARHDAWVASIAAMAGAIDRHLAAAAAGNPEATLRSVVDLDRALDDYEQRKRDTVAACP